MKLYIKDVKGLIIPSQATPEDAAYDVVATTEAIVVGDKVPRRMDNLEMWNRIAYIEYGTNLYVEPETEMERKIVGFRSDASGALCDVEWNEIGVRYHTQIFPRSSISKMNLILANSVGTIDNGYRNQIMCRFKYQFQPEDYLVVSEAGGTRVYGVINYDHIYKQFDKMVQIKACPNIPIELVKIPTLGKTVRDQGGFGSTGR